MTTKAESDTHTPPQSVADNARRALEVRAEKPPSQRGMTPVGLARARQLANRQPVSVATLRRMVSYFARHEVDKEGATWEEQGAGWQAWMGWGGDEGWAWARRIIEAEDTKSFDDPHIMEIGGRLPMDYTVKTLPTTVKAIGEYRIKGLGIVFGGFDLVGDRFTAETDFGGSRPFQGMPVYYNHAMDGIKSQIGEVATWTPTDEGIVVEIELYRRHQYVGEVMKLVEAGALGLSSGAVAHLVMREPIKGGYEMKRWPAAEMSVTPIPAEPRTTLGEIAKTPEDLGLVKNIKVKSTEVEPASMAADETMPDDTETTPDAAEVATESPEETKAMPEGIIDNARNDEPQVKAALPAAPSENPFDSNEYHRAYKRFIDVKNPIEKAEDSYDVHQVLRNATKAYAVKTQTEGTSNDGGFTVPTAVNRSMVARRDESSLLGQFRFMRVTTDTWKVVVPAQSTKAAAAIVGEGVTATASEPNIANTKTIQLYKDTLEFAITEELLADTASNYEEFLMNEIARAMAVSVNTFIIKGTGSSQPYGIYARVTNDIALGATTATSAQVLSVSTGINGAYMTNGETGWVMRNATWGVVRGLDLANTGMLLTSMEGGVRRIESWPVALSEQVDAYGTSTNEPLIFGNFSYYAFAERTAGVQIERDYNPRTGVTYMIAKWRFGGDVTQPEAFAIGKHA
jgi:HK97 family phage major capsid protein